MCRCLLCAFSVSIPSHVSIGAAHAKACTQALGSGVDWRARELRVISLPLSPRGDSADRTLPGSQLQPLITPTARPSPLWSLTLGGGDKQGETEVCVCVCVMGKGGWSSQGMLWWGRAGRVGRKKGGGSKEGLRERRKRMKRKGGEKGGEQQREVSSQYSSFFQS